MKIVEARELSVPLLGGGTNAVVDFSEHTVSLVALISDVVRDGRVISGIAFNSIGRFSQSGILRNRMFPRLRKADPGSLLNDDGIDPAKVLDTVMQNEKPGGHGDRGAAAAAIELAAWDLRAKLNDRPAWAEIARYFGRDENTGPVPVYAAGGYYRNGADAATLKSELQTYADQGYDSFKIKIGGANLRQDLQRVEASLCVAGAGEKLAVDANARFDLPTALSYSKAMEPYGLRWFEEPGDPLDYELQRILGEAYDHPLATGENLFAQSEVRNLLRYGRVRSMDVLQMDAGLSYGLTEYASMIDTLQQHGLSAEQAHPHGGHLINLHIVAGLGLGGCEVYPGVFQPFGGYPANCRPDNGKVYPPHEPGFCLETKPELQKSIREILG